MPPKVLTITLLVLGSFLALTVIALKFGTKTPEEVHESQSSNPPQRDFGQSPSSNSHNGASNEVSQQFSNGRCVGQGSTQLKASPLNVNSLKLIFPMGKMTGAHVTPTDHQYWLPTGAQSLGGLTDDPEKYEIRAPAEGYVVSLEHSTQAITEGSKQPPEDDYRIIIEHSCTFYTILIHINKVKKEILDQINLRESASAAGHSSGAGRVKVKAGEIIGRSGAHQFDFSLVNTEVSLPGFLKPDSYKAEPWKIHTVDPFDYFEEPLRSQLVAKSVRTTVPLGGKIDYDLPDRLVGNWFREGSGGYFGNQANRGAGGRYWDSHLAIVYDPIDPTQITISTGNFQGRAAQFGVVSNSPDPKNVDGKTGGVKYELVERDYQTSSGQAWNERTFDQNLKFRTGSEVKGVALFQVLPNQKIKVEFFPGKRAAQVLSFDAKAQIYVR